MLNIIQLILTRTRIQMRELIFAFFPSRDAKPCEKQKPKGDTVEHLTKEDCQNTVNQAIENQAIGNQTISSPTIDDQLISNTTINDPTANTSQLQVSTSEQTSSCPDQSADQSVDQTDQIVDQTVDQSVTKSPAQSISQSANRSFSEHNRCFIEPSDEQNSSDEGISTCDVNERNYNWCRLSHNEQSIVDLANLKNSNKLAQDSRDRPIRDRHCMMEHFADGINVSGISRRRILANIDYEVDGQFMCSTLIKSNEDKQSSKPKFQDLDECDSSKSASLTSDFARSSSDLPRKGNTTRRGEIVDVSLQLSNRKLELISKQMKEVEETIQRQMNGNKHKQPNSISHRKSSTNTLSSQHKSSKSNSTTSRPDDELLIYDHRKPFSDLSSIEEARLDHMRNGLKAMQMDTIDKHRIFNKYFNEDYDNGRAKLDLDSIADENLRSELYNSKHSTLINQIKKIQNHHNNQVVHSLMADTEDIWYCKTKLYDDTLDEIVKKWTSLDYEIWCKIILFERNRRVAKAYIRLPYLIVTGSKIGFDGYSIGLNGFENIYRDQETDFIVKNLEKGVRIKIDNEGNLILRKMTHLSVQIKDWLQQLTDGTGSLSDDVIALQGIL